MPRKSLKTLSLKKSLKSKLAKRKSKKVNSRKRTPIAKKEVSIENVMGRCMKCRDQKLIMNAKQVVLKNGRNAIKGECKCGTKMFKFV
jgi:hypothetical protein